MPPLLTVIHCHWSANDLHNMPIINGSFQGIVVLIWTWRSDALVDWGNLGSTFHWVTYSHFLGSLFGLYWNSIFITLFTKTHPRNLPFTRYCNFKSVQETRDKRNTKQHVSQNSMDSFIFLAVSIKMVFFELRLGHSESVHVLFLVD